MRAADRKRWCAHGRAYHCGSDAQRAGSAEVVNFRISPTIRWTLEHEKDGGDKIKVGDSGIRRQRGIIHRQRGVGRSKDGGGLFPDYVITPYPWWLPRLRLYTDIADGVYRFQPFRSMSDGLSTIRAAGERRALSRCAKDSLLYGAVK